jgi:hypothetical protein
MQVSSTAARALDKSDQAAQLARPFTLVVAAVWSLHRRIDTRVRQVLGQAPRCPSRDRMRPWNAKVPAARRATGRERSDTVWTDFQCTPPTFNRRSSHVKQTHKNTNLPLPNPTAHEACIRFVRP